MKTVTGLFTSRDDAARAATALRAAGIPDRNVNFLAPAASARQLESVPTDEGEQPGMGKALGAVAGVIATALLGAGGAAIGGALENALSHGLPKDELFVYEEALRRGRTIVIVLVEDEATAERERDVLMGEGAESVDPARELG